MEFIKSFGCRRDTRGEAGYFLTVSVRMAICVPIDVVADGQRAVIPRSMPLGCPTFHGRSWDRQFRTWPTWAKVLQLLGAVCERASPSQRKDRINCSSDLLISTACQSS